MITCQTHDTIPADLVSNDPSRPRFSISQVSTLTASFADDVRVYAAGGLDAIGIWEMKLGDGPDTEALEQFAASGLGAASAIPAVPSVLPLPLLPGPDDPQERIEAVCASIHRLAAFGPTAIVCLTGPAGDTATATRREPLSSTGCARSAPRPSAPGCGWRSNRSSSRESRTGRS